MTQLRPVSKISLFVFLFSLGTVVQAEELKWKPFDFDMALHLLMPYNQIEGDFDGESFYLGQDTRTGAPFVLVIPEIESHFGQGIGIGVKNQLQNDIALSADATYLWSDHKATWLGASGDVKYKCLSVDLKLYFMANTRTQPFLRVGLGLPRVQVVEGYLSFDSVKDVTFEGNSFNTGVGVLHYFTPQWSLTAGLVHRNSTFNRVDFGESLTLDQKLKSSTMNYELGLSYRFAGRYI